jgi:hypothetical protein
VDIDISLCRWRRSDLSYIASVGKGHGLAFDSPLSTRLMACTRHVCYVLPLSWHYSQLKVVGYHIFHRHTSRQLPYSYILESWRSGASAGPGSHRTSIDTSPSPITGTSPFHRYPSIALDNAEYTSWICWYLPENGASNCLYFLCIQFKYRVVSFELKRYHIFLIAHVAKWHSLRKTYVCGFGVTKRFVGRVFVHLLSAVSTLPSKLPPPNTTHQISNYSWRIGNLRPDPTSMVRFTQHWNPT